MNLIESIKIEKVTQQELLQVSAFSTGAMSELEVHKKISRQARNPGHAAAIHSRMKALDALIVAEVLGGWVKKQADGTSLIAEPVWHTTATEPLVFAENDKMPCFDVESFVEAILRNAEGEGIA